MYRFLPTLAVVEQLPMQSQLRTLDAFYQAIDSLIAALIAEHHPDEAQRLHTLLHQTAWTTGSELLEGAADRPERRAGPILPRDDPSHPRLPALRSPASSYLAVEVSLSVDGEACPILTVALSSLARLLEKQM